MRGGVVVSTAPRPARWGRGLFNWFRRIFSPPSEGAATIERVEREKQAVRHKAGQFMALAMAARLAVIDGPSNDEEIAAARSLFTLEGKGAGEVRRVFLEAVHDNCSARHYAERLAVFFPENRVMYRTLVGQMIYLAAADMPINVAEFEVLEQVVKCFHLPRAEFVELLSPYILPGKPENAHKMLGIARGASLEVIKLAYTQATQAYHPDRLAGSGVASDIIRLANERMRILNEVWQKLKKKAEMKKEAKG